MILKTKIYTAFISLTVFFLCLISINCDYSTKLSKGNEVAAKIEKFRKENLRLPNSLSESGIEETESGPIYYQKKSESKYILWFGKELGESATYDSETKQWK